ncbi:Ig-like domain-containing protein [Sphingomonas colocasiae]|uniref:Tandem-95 repeat protein n=1 Tax=Sphingomonas colocasiae TaxID=1848973 RepID=A0ABS7PT23_9SPHN|nr:Ig-like domain-containing protein [Sphingomonas colocasiae]MBY8824498.1 tandem-95 repeat protein [Sphingomonas colocasiae]
MVDASASAAVGALSPEAGQDAGGAAASDDSDSDGGDSTPLIIGGVVLLGGGAALAAGGGGGGKKNTAPTVNATQAVTTNEDTKATITVAGTDADGDTLTYTASAPTKGAVTVAGNVLTYTPNANANGTDTFTVTVSDGKGGTATQTVTVTITPVNDAPVGVAATNTATEDGPVVTGKLAATDVDGDTLTYALTGTVPAGLTLNADGSYSFDPASYDSLAAGVKQDVVANYTVSDGKGGTATSTLTITVTGVNDAPVATAATNTATEDGAVVTGQLVATDADAGATLTYAISGTAPAGLTINSNGSYSFDPASYDSIGAGVTQDVVATYTVTDDKGATHNSTLTITVTGVNDAPVAVAATAAATEDGAVVTGQLAATDVDAGDTLTYTLNAPVTGLTLNANGSYSFDPASYDSLGAGATQAVVANYTVSDGKGGTSTSTLTITVTGVNDAPVAVDDSFSVDEDAALSGNVALNDTDVDAGDTLTFALVGSVDGLTFNPNGTFNFNADHPSYDSIAAGSTRVVTFNYTVSDGHGGSDTGTASITVNGKNDAPVLTSATTGSFNENIAAGSTIYTATATDVDQGSVLSYSISGADAGLLAINSATGAVTIIASPNYEAKQSYDFTVTVSDGIASVSQDVALSVNDLVDQLSIDVGDAQNPVTIDASGNSPADVLDVNYQFNESGNTANEVVIQNFGTNDYILFSTLLGNYNFTNTNGDLVITQANGGVVSRIVIDGIFDVVDPGLLANNPDAAEAAINAALGTTGVDYLRSSAVPSETRSADLDNDNDPNTPASSTGPNPVLAFDAQGVAVTYTENANVGNDVIIANFSSDDKIVVSNANPGDYNFTVAQNGHDLIINLTTGVVNRITLEGFFDSNPGIFDVKEQTVEAYVGFDFFSYA